jgi:hypothetical protein
MALILAQLIEREGIGARPESAEALSMSRILSLDTKDVALVCLCYVADPSSAQVRYAIRRLRRKATEAFMLVSIIAGADDVSGPEAVRACQADDVRKSLSDTIDRIKSLARGGQGATDQTEAMVCGTPVLACRKGSASEIVGQGAMRAV